MINDDHLKLFWNAIHTICTQQEYRHAFYLTVYTTLDVQDLTHWLPCTLLYYHELQQLVRHLLTLQHLTSESPLIFEFGMVGNLCHRNDISRLRKIFDLCHSLLLKKYFWDWYCSSIWVMLVLLFECLMLSSTFYYY